MYKVLKKFADLQDRNHTYQPDDIYPRAGLEVSDARIAELSGTSNRIGVPLIEKIPQPTPEGQNLTAEAVETPVVDNDEVKPKKRRKKANKE